ncbi:uncharacterized protein PFLUO_LOCUS3509 [Penicillium psychrofluorescens]|uniref:uncharacterized protein n=1 Tax=Penicillium psychrofluorescens TaxID=3158075 RepID=UPI003CCD0CC8
MTMAPQIKSFVDLDFILETFNPETEEFLHTSFAVFNDEALFYGQLNIPKANLSLAQISNALAHVPDDKFFPQWPVPEMELIEAPATLTSGIYLKRPNLELYGIMKEHSVTNVEQQLAQQFLAEAEVMNALSKHPHPNIVRYYGCRVVRGHITGLVMDRHPHDLYCHLKEGVGNIEKEPFMAALKSAIQHLHALGWAHNDLTPSNILVNRDGMPVLIDFGGCQPVGTHLKYIRGTKEWIDGKTEDYHTSDAKHDVSALVKLGAWLDKPVFTV